MREDILKKMEKKSRGLEWLVCTPLLIGFILVMCSALWIDNKIITYISLANMVVTVAVTTLLSIKIIKNKLNVLQRLMRLSHEKECNYFKLCTNLIKQGKTNEATYFCHDFITNQNIKNICVGIISGTVLANEREKGIGLIDGLVEKTLTKK